MTALSGETVTCRWYYISHNERYHTNPNPPISLDGINSGLIFPANLLLCSLLACSILWPSFHLALYTFSILLSLRSRDFLFTWSPLWRPDPPSATPALVNTHHSRAIYANPWYYFCHPHILTDYTHVRRFEVTYWYWNRLTGWGVDLSSHDKVRVWVSETPLRLEGFICSLPVVLWIVAVTLRLILFHHSQHHFKIMAPSRNSAYANPPAALLETSFCALLLSVSRRKRGVTCPNLRLFADPINPNLVSLRPLQFLPSVALSSPDYTSSTSSCG